MSQLTQIQTQLTQIQTQQRHLDSNNKQLFTYQTSCGVKYFPFRIGDIVRVIDWGETYSTYTKAFIYFTNNANKPYYCGLALEIEERRKKDGDKQYFKIIKIAEHEQNNSILCYIQDRTKRGVVIGIEGLKLVKQFPLRKNETINIVLKKIK